MRRGYVLDDDSLVTAIAASAYAIHSIEEDSSNFNNKVQISRANTRKQESLKPPKSGSMRDIRNASRGPSFADDRQRQKGRVRNNSYDKADAWERAQIASIRKRYEKMYSDIQSWENERKLRQRINMEKKMIEMEMRMTRNMKHYQRKLARIDHIALGARTQLQEKQRYEESLVKEKMRKIRSTGKTPVASCFCF